MALLRNMFSRPSTSSSPERASKFAVTMDRPVEEITPEAMQHLVEYDYPGNVRELSNFIERGVALAQGEVLDVEHLPQQLGRLTVRVFAPKLAAPPATLEAQEKAHILQALKLAGGNRSEAARMLGSTACRCGASSKNTA